MRPSLATGSTPARIGRLAFLFVVLALTTLIVVPLWNDRRIHPLRVELDEGTEPARTLVTRIQFSLARQMSALRGYLLTGDTTFLDTYARALELERRAYRDLDPLAGRLGGEVNERFVELRTLSGQWHRRLDEEGVSGGLPVSRDAAALARVEQALYQEMLRTSSALDDAIVEAARQRREEIREAERRGLVVNGLLVLLAFLAVLVVGWFARRVRLLAEEAGAEREKAERALAEATRAGEVRSRLLRGITHDVKNPLGAADGYAELLEMGLRGPLAPEQDRLVQGIRRSIHDALDIVHDLLALSRAEAEDLPVEHAPVDLAEVAREVVEDHRGAAEARGHALELELPPGPVTLATDAGRVRQILGNLLSNALKYTPGPGRVTVSAAMADGGAPGAGCWGVVRVADTGPGIPPEERERIFEEFHRLHAGTVRGHGLGLAISRKIAHLLGGEVTVESEVGSGSVFTLWIPMRDGAP